MWIKKIKSYTHNPKNKLRCSWTEFLNYGMFVFCSLDFIWLFRWLILDTFFQLSWDEFLTLFSRQWANSYCKRLPRKPGLEYVINQTENLSVSVDVSRWRFCGYFHTYFKMAATDDGSKSKPIANLHVMIFLKFPNMSNILKHAYTVSIKKWFT